MKEYKETNHTLLFKSLSDFAFYCAGLEECEPKHNYGPICRSYQLIHFILSGRGKLHINDHVFTVSEGDAFIIPSNKVAYYEADSENPWHYVWIGFLGINSQMYTYQLMNSTNEIYVFHNLDINKYKENIFKIIELQGSSTSNYFKANSILFDIMSSLYEDLNFNEDFGFKNSLADEIKFFMDINYPEKIKIVDIAKTFGIHPNYLSKIFSQKYELSPKRYLIELKLKKACKLLTTTELPISIIANSLGFDDQLAFSKIFKKELSISPSEYRKFNKA
jgi:AraC-like DNA-binding protein